MRAKRNYPGTEKVESKSKGDHCHYSLSTVEPTMFHDESLSREVLIFKHSIPFSVSERRRNRPGISDWRLKDHWADRTAPAVTY
jgi:hypothetical protein